MGGTGRVLNGRRRAGRGVRALALRGKQGRTMSKRKSKEKRTSDEPATAESASAAEWRRFAEVARELAEMSAPSWARWRKASLLLTTGASAAIEAADENGGEPSGDLLAMPETLRAVEIMDNDPPELANAFLRGAASPVADSADMKKFREHFWCTVSDYEGFFRECMQKRLNPLTPQKDLDDFKDWREDARRIAKMFDIEHFRFSAFAVYFSVCATCLRQELAHYLLRNPKTCHWIADAVLDGCAAYRRARRECFPRWDKTAAGLARQIEDEKRLRAEFLGEMKKRGGKVYAELPMLYENAYTGEQWTDANGNCAAPKYGGGGVKSGRFLASFMMALRTLQGKPNGILAEESARRSESATGADMGGAAQDGLLSAYARRIISNYRAGISFDFLTDAGRVHISDLTQKQWEAARRLLETSPEDEAAGWVKMPDGWKIPQRCKGGQATFFDRVHSRAQESANGKGAGYYRIARDIAKRGRGGKRAGSGRPRKQ